MNDDNDAVGKARGGFARAESLSAEERRAIARKAAAARWDKAAFLPRSEYPGQLQIGEMIFPCSVLSDGTRVLTQSDFMDRMGMYYSGWVSKNRSAEDQSAEVPQFLSFKSLKPFVDKHLGDLQSIVLKYRTERGNVAHGIKAEIIPKICEVWLDADENNQLGARQRQIAARAKVLMRALAHVGIIALVDEATGYQEVRGRQALQAILDAFLRKELAAWAKRFPDEFYEQIFRLRKWQWRGRGTNPPQVVASYTKDIVYARLAPGIIDELERKNPSEHGKRRSKHHQWLTEDVGHPALAQHLHAVITLMRISTSWDQFKLFLDQAHPKRGDTMQLPLMIDVPSPAKPIEKLPLFGQSPDASQA
jgi:P63C domain